jgi:shikimate dehydrogenase
MAPRGAETPIAADRLTGGLVYDLVYNPSVTRLLREAEQAGCRVIGGLEMLVAQAQEQFHWWTGERPQPGVMRAAALRRLAELEADENHVA